MFRIEFQAFGHENIIGEHKTTIELTSEDFLTKKGTCIIGIRSTITLSHLSPEIKRLAMRETTNIVLTMEIDGIVESVRGSGGKGLTYSDTTSMVARTSSYQCERTLMINSDKAASDLGREFISSLRQRDAVLNCELQFITQ
ncbi:DUF371 domain-containing protein [Candidatus Thorarchaeota archaeon]|nr:MAG: DUF371 domain-containing protein [Candidatus Thorarchaeota archaeon]